MRDDGGEGYSIDSDLRRRFGRINLSLEEVEDMTSVLKFDSENSDYRGYLAARKAFDIINTEILFNATKEHFHNFMGDYLSSLELNPTDKKPTDSYHLDGKTKLWFAGEPTIIDSASKGSEPIAVYYPNVSFNTTPRKIRAKTLLERHGDGTTLNTLEDLFLETYWSVPNQKRPGEISFSDEGIIVSNIEDTPRILRALERLYQNERLEDLIDIKKALASEKVQGYAATILEDEYEKGLRKAIPRRFSF